MRRTVLVLLVVPLVLFVAGEPAGAEPPQPVDHHFVWEGCGFPVQIDRSGMEAFRTWFDAEGDFNLIHNDMGVSVTATNTATGESITVMESGVLRYMETPDDTWTQELSGSRIWFFNPSLTEADNPEDDDPGLWYTIGQLSWTGDSSAFPLSFESTGQFIDLCSLLAS
jgi:hypothetical protein